MCYYTLKKKKKKKKVFKFLLDGRCNNYNIREWKNLCKCQTKVGALSDTPFLTVTAALLNNIIPIAIGRQRLLLNRFKYNTNPRASMLK